ncbi:hypothetical protein EBQ74_11125 [bacterium]|nr:hypothetical protein [bacterium]
MFLVLNNLRKRRYQGFRTFVSSLVLICFSAPSPASAITMSKLKGNTGFQAMVVAIANLNQAMQQATINPQDKIHRQRVAAAYSAMPLAIQALAQEFKSNKLHGADFKFVQGILGGFVQKDLTSKVEEFMKNPSRNNMPNVGSGFPEEAIRQAERSYITANISESAVANTKLNPSSTANSAFKGPSDLVDLNSKETILRESSSQNSVRAAVGSTITADINQSS